MTAKQNKEVTYHCKRCGKKCIGRYMYCSDACRKAEYSEREAKRQREARRAAPRVCKTCGRQFIVSKKHIHYCSDECRNNYKVKKPKAEAEKQIQQRSVCQRKPECLYGVRMNGVGAVTVENSYCAYAELTGCIRGGWPDECTVFREKDGKKRRRKKKHIVIAK